MINNYEEALAHMFQVDMLNVKGLRDYVKILRGHLSEANIKVIGLENQLEDRKQKALSSEDESRNQTHIVDGKSLGVLH